MDYESFLELAKRRRSVRSLKPEPIPDEFVDKIVEAARWAPSGGNSQPWEFIVVKEQGLKDRIVELVNEWDSIIKKMEINRQPELRSGWSPAEWVQAPVFIILCGDPRTKDAYALMSSVTPQRSDSIFTSSLANAFLHMHLAASTLGLGSKWVTTIAYPYVQSFVKNLLGVPTELEIYDMMAVGYPNVEPKPRMVRTRGEMVHYDHYDMTKFRTDAQVEQYIVTYRHTSKLSAR